MSAIEFKVGDRVRIRTDLSTKKLYGGLDVIPYMTSFKGQCFEIKEVKKSNTLKYYKLDGVFGGWTDEMLEPIIRGGKNMIGSLFIKDENLKVVVNEVQTKNFSDKEKVEVQITGYIDKTLSNQKPIKPLKIYTNEKKKVVVVKWEDGTTTKATCSQDDHFDVTVGFAMCYVKKVYGGKKNLLNKVKKLSK